MKVFKRGIIWLGLLVVICSCSVRDKKIPVDSVSRIVMIDTYQEIKEDADYDDYDDVLLILEGIAQLQTGMDECDCAPDAFMKIYCEDGNTYSLMFSRSGATYLSDDYGLISSGWRMIPAEKLLLLYDIWGKYF